MKRFAAERCVQLSECSQSAEHSAVTIIRESKPQLAQTEVLIIGCGIAGATAALRLARNPRASDHDHYSRRRILMNRTLVTRRAGSSVAVLTIVPRTTARRHPRCRCGRQLTAGGADSCRGRSTAVARDSGGNTPVSCLTDSAEGQPVMGQRSCTFSPPYSARWGHAPARRSLSDLLARADSVVPISRSKPMRPRSI